LFLNSSSRAYQLLFFIKQSEYILTTFVLAKVFCIIMSLSKYYQTKSINLIHAIKNANIVKYTIENIRKNELTNLKLYLMKLNLNDSSLNICKKYLVEKIFKKLIAIYKKILLMITLVFLYLIHEFIVFKMK